MKWYSVLKYKPSITCSECIVRTKGGAIAMASNVEMVGGFYKWEAHSEDEKLDDVTHFMIPGPIEIENE